MLTDTKHHQRFAIALVYTYVYSCVYLNIQTCRQSKTTKLWYSKLFWEKKLTKMQYFNEKTILFSNQQLQYFNLQLKNNHSDIWNFILKVRASELGFFALLCYILSWVTPDCYILRSFNWAWYPAPYSKKTKMHYVNIIVSAQLISYVRSL